MTPGVYVLEWSHAKWRMELLADGSYFCDKTWKGTWHWCGKTRTLRVNETSSFGYSYMTWSVVLDKDMRGSGGYDNSGTTGIAIRPDGKSVP